MLFVSGRAKNKTTKKRRMTDFWRKTFLWVWNIKHVFIMKIASVTLWYCYWIYILPVKSRAWPHNFTNRGDCAPFCWMPVPSKGSGKSCICVLVVYILALSVIFSIKFGNCSDSMVSFVFHFIVYFHYGLRASYPPNVRSLCSTASHWFTDFPSYSSGISADRDITVIFLSGINYHFPPIPLLATTYCHTRIQIWNVD